MRAATPAVFGLLILLLASRVGVAQDVDSSRAQVENLTVMIDAQFADDPNPEWGTGIIAGLNGSTLTILTATHVYQPRASVTATRIDVRLRWTPNSRTFQAHPIKAVGDLAVLQVDLPADALPPADTLQFAAIGDAASISGQDGVRPLGHGRGALWATCLAPDAFDKVLADSIVFESRCVESGHSGGPLVDEAWRIVGMVRVDQQPAGVALAIEPALAAVRSWGITIDLEKVNEQDENVFSAVAVGVGVACGLTLKSRVFCWGANDRYALGAGTERSFRALVGVPLADRHRFTAVGAGGRYGCALTVGGATLCWGERPGVPRAKPTVVPNDPGFRSISTGNTHACGVTPDGAGYCWGANTRGQLGDGSKEGSEQPVRVKGSEVWEQISAGSSITCGLTREGKAYCWGENISGIVASQNGEVINSGPVAVGSDREWLQISAGGAIDIGSEGRRFVCGIARGDRRAYCWGRPAYQWTKRLESTFYVPLAFAPEHTFSNLASGEHHVCGVTTERRVLCWGREFWGETGTRFPSSEAAANLIDGIDDASSVSVNDKASCVLRKNGKIGCWGNDDDPIGIGGSPNFSTAPTFSVRISHCATPDLGEVPDHLDTVRQLILHNLREDAKSGAVFEAMLRVEHAVQIVRGQVLACERYAELDQNLTTLERLKQLESKLDTLRTFFMFSPTLPPEPVARKKMSKSEAAQYAAEQREYEARKAAAESERLENVRQLKTLSEEYLRLERDLRVRD